VCVCIHIYIYIQYIFIYIYICIYIYLYKNIYVFIYKYIYIYISFTDYVWMTAASSSIRAAAVRLTHGGESKRWLAFATRRWANFSPKLRKYLNLRPMRHFFHFSCHGIHVIRAARRKSARRSQPLASVHWLYIWSTKTSQRFWCERSVTDSPAQRQQKRPKANFCETLR